jgi:hypothetical protein
LFSLVSKVMWHKKCTFWPRSCVRIEGSTSNQGPPVPWEITAQERLAPDSLPSNWMQLPNRQLWVSNSSWRQQVQKSHQNGDFKETCSSLSKALVQFHTENLQVLVLNCFSSRYPLWDLTCSIAWFYF